VTVAVAVIVIVVVRTIEPMRLIDLTTTPAITSVLVLVLVMRFVVGRGAHAFDLESLADPRPTCEPTWYRVGNSRGQNV
jgi:hypothetical protein